MTTDTQFYVEKLSGEVIKYVLDISPFLATDDGIFSIAVSAKDLDDVSATSTVIDSSSATNDQVTLFLKAGTADEDYFVIVKVTTDDSNVLTFGITLHIRSLAHSLLKKYALDTFYHTIDFTPRLSSTEDLSTPVVTAIDEAGADATSTVIVAESGVLLENAVTGKLKAGTSGSSYYVSFQADTTEGQTLIHLVKLYIRPQ